MESSTLFVIGRRPPEGESKVALRFYTSGRLTTLLFQLKTEVNIEDVFILLDCKSVGDGRLFRIFWTTRFPAKVEED
jgi:hypothetical protein